MSGKKDLVWRAYLVYLGFFIALIVVIVKTIMIQTEGTASFFTNAKEKIETRTAKRYPRRGEILDRNYTPLLTSSRQSPSAGRDRSPDPTAAAGARPGTGSDA